MAEIVLVMPIANRFDKVSVRVPNGLLAIAALPVEQGYSVKIIDLKVDDQWERSLKESIGEETLCVGITCSTGRMIYSALNVARSVRKIDATLPIVWGGPHPTLMPEQTLENPYVDIIVINEGDESFYALVQALKQKAELSTVQGIGYKKDGKPILTPPAPLVTDIDALPMFPYQLLDLKRYSTLTKDNLPSLDILSSRGCPYGCTFCSTPTTSGRRWRAMSEKRIMEYIRHLYETYGIRTFYFVDDNFMVDLKRVNRFLDVLKESGLKIYWGTQGVTVDTLKKMTPELLDKIEASGCLEFSVGIESANPEILKSISKNIDIKDVHAANEKLKGRDIAIKYNMIIGFPADTEYGRFSNQTSGNKPSCVVPV